MGGFQSHCAARRPEHCTGATTTFHFVVIVERQDLPLALARLGCHQPPAKARLVLTWAIAARLRFPGSPGFPGPLLFLATCPPQHCRRARKIDELPSFS